MYLIQQCSRVLHPPDEEGLIVQIIRTLTLAHGTSMINLNCEEDYNGNIDYMYEEFPTTFPMYVCSKLVQRCPVDSTNEEKDDEKNAKSLLGFFQEQDILCMLL